MQRLVWNPTQSLNHDHLICCFDPSLNKGVQIRDWDFESLKRQKQNKVEWYYLTVFKAYTLDKKMST